MITSTGNSQVKNIINLLKKSGERRRCGLFAVEGLKMFLEIPKERIDKIYASESFAYANKELLSNYAFEMVSDKVYGQMSDTKTPQGILAVVNMLEYTMDDIIPAERVPLVLMLENIQDPGNLGTMIRTAEGAGVTGIIMSGDTVDIYNPKAIRSTMGSLFRMPFIYSDDICETADVLKERGVRLYAAHLNGDNNYFEEDMTVPSAIMIGNEGNGLSEKLADKADKLIKIPMSGSLESLNAAVSSAVIMYEVYRQRHRI